eukprot:2265191-Prorocentrum_lima.AAC.1
MLLHSNFRNLYTAQSICGSGDDIAQIRSRILIARTREVRPPPTSPPSVPAQEIQHGTVTGPPP